MAAIEGRDLHAAFRRFETLMIEYGLTSPEVLHEFRGAARKQYNDPRIAVAIAEADYILTHANNEYIQLNAMIARIAGEVFP